MIGDVTSREPDFAWAGRPVFRCRICGPRYERVGDLESVLRHEAEAHKTKVRTSGILGPDGRPIEVEG